LNRIVQVFVPVDFLSARNVSGVVKKNILIALEDSQISVTEMSGEPFCRYQRFGMSVTLSLDSRFVV
jgi:hypothetical protein